MSGPGARRPAVSEQGSVTVEMALALPVVVAVLCAALLALTAVGAQLRLQHVTASAARAQGRGDADAARELLATGAADAATTIEHRGDVVCLTCRRILRASVVPIGISATSCAPVDGR